MGFFDIFSDPPKAKTLENLSCICINEWNDGYTSTADQIIPFNIKMQSYTGGPTIYVASGMKNKIKNPKLFQSRILGLVSYFKTSDRSLLPEVTKNELIELDMSDYQFLNYSIIRKNEIEMDKNKGRKKKTVAKKSGDKEETEKSSYRAYSRMHCSFVFPESIPRPYPNDTFENEDDIEIYERPIDNMGDDGKIDIDLDEQLSKDKKALIKQYERAKSNTLKKLDKQKHQYLIVNDEDKLLKYSPKYNFIVNKILGCPGNVFVYTEYRSLEGINVFAIVLKANGFAPFLIRKKENGEFEQYYENPDDKDKPKYALWGGDEETSDIIRKI